MSTVIQKWINGVAPIMEVARNSNKKIEVAWGLQKVSRKNEGGRTAAAREHWDVPRERIMNKKADDSTFCHSNASFDVHTQLFTVNEALKSHSCIVEGSELPTSRLSKIGAVYVYFAYFYISQVKCQ